MAFAFSVLFLPIIIIVALLVLLNFVPIGLWISALASGVQVGIINLIGMRLRRVPPAKIILPLIKAVKAGLDVSADKLEAHFLAGGNVDRVIDALIAAQRAEIGLSFERAAAIDLAGRNVLEAVQMSVNPKVIETPIVAAVAKDGIELKAKARVTVRANIERLVGGAGEATIIARVGEGIVTTVGSAESHKEVLENPDKISQTVLNKGLDAGTAFEILSIDIADFVSSLSPSSARGLAKATDSSLSPSAIPMSSKSATKSLSSRKSGKSSPSRLGPRLPQVLSSHGLTVSPSS
jgi:uncharacterized protein YqfA (UPF0365 family)